MYTNVIHLYLLALYITILPNSIRFNKLALPFLICIPFFSLSDVTDKNLRKITE